MGLGLVVGVDPAQQVVEVGAGEFGAERAGDGVVARLEGGEAVADLVEAGEVVGCEGFALDDGEVDFGLVEPGGALGQVDQVRVRPGAGDPGERGGAAVGGAVVGDPEHPAGAGVRLGGHDLLDQPGERGDPGGGLAPAGDLPAADVPGGQVGDLGKPGIPAAPAVVDQVGARGAGLAARLVPER